MSCVLMLLELSALCCIVLLISMSASHSCSVSITHGSSVPMGAGSSYIYEAEHEVNGLNWFSKSAVAVVPDAMPSRNHSRSKSC